MPRATWKPICGFIRNKNIFRSDPPVDLFSCKGRFQLKMLHADAVVEQDD
jgi:hypothetical protein